MDSLRILYISSVDVSLTKGPSANEREFIPSLYKLIGDNAHFLIPEPQETLPKDIPVSACTFTISHKERKLLPWLFHQLSIIKEVDDILLKNKVDLIVIRANIFAFAYRYITNKHGIPYTLKTASSGEFQVFERKNILFRALKRLNLNIYKKLVNNAIFVDVVSPMQRDKLRVISGAGEKIQRIDNGVNIERFKPFDKKKCRRELGLEKFDQIIGYAGNLPWDRGGMQIVQSLPKLAKTCPNVGAVILGGGTGMEKLYNKAKKLGVYEKCVFTGKVPYEEVVTYINSMDICVSQRYEDTQGASELKVRQYLACGKPVIVSPGGANDFVDEEGIGFVVDPNDEEQFFKKINFYLNLGHQDYEGISSKARQYAINHLSYESKVLKRLDYWQKLLNEV